MKAPKNHTPSKKRYRIGILTAPANHASVAPISNLLEILQSISEGLVLITGNASYDRFKGNSEIVCFDNSHPIEESPLKKIVYYLRAQFREASLIWSQRNSTDIWFFFMGGEREFIPILTARLLRKHAVLILTGSVVKSAKYSKDPFFLAIKMLNEINCSLVSAIILYSLKLIPDIGLEKYQDKIVIAQRHYVNLELFRCFSKFEERPDIIGYIGRLSEEKGVLNFVDAIPKIHSEQPSLRFFIAGEGPLRDEIRTRISSFGLEDTVTIVDWIPHTELPLHLNKLKLLVIPSYTEGLPNIMLEAMACGTPVLVTPVGAIQDIIINEKTGFQLLQNNPDEIGKSIIRIINQPDLKIIAYMGKHCIETKFSFETSKESYAKMLSHILKQ